MLLLLLSLLELLVLLATGPDLIDLIDAAIAIAIAELIAPILELLLRQVLLVRVELSLAETRGLVKLEVEILLDLISARQGDEVLAGAARGARRRPRSRARP